jgi:Tfp pilus assembly protein PilW
MTARDHWCKANVEQPDAGVSLIETIVGMFLTALLGLIVMQAFIASSKGARHVADDAAVQQYQQTVVERLSRDLRVARGVDVGSNATQVIIWVDSNSDYARDPGEIVTWRMAVVAGKCSISRSTDPLTVRVLAPTIANFACGTDASHPDPAFSYFDGTGGPPTSTPTTSTTRIDVSLSFRAVNSTAAARVSQFSLRMRNVA